MLFPGTGALKHSGPFLSGSTDFLPPSKRSSGTGASDSSLLTACTGAVEVEVAAVLVSVEEPGFGGALPMVAFPSRCVTKCFAKSVSFVKQVLHFEQKKLRSSGIKTLRLFSMTLTAGHKSEGASPWQVFRLI